MKSILLKEVLTLGLFWIPLLFDVCTNAINLNTGGATNSDALYKATLFAYSYEKPDVDISYTSVGSVLGKQMLLSHTLDCAMSVSPFTAADIAANPSYVNLPTFASAIVPVFNLPQYANYSFPFVLDGPTLSGIFSGNITRWNDPAIVATNPFYANELTNHTIGVVVRGDGAGITYQFLSALGSFSPAFAAETVPADKITWNSRIPRVQAIGEFNLLSYIQVTPYTLGYAFLGSANELNVDYSYMVNQAGAIVSPSDESVRAAMLELGGSMDSRFIAELVNGQSDAVWPITQFQYLLYDHNSTVPCDRRAAMVNFWNWFYSDPTMIDIRSAHNFVTIPNAFTDRIFNELFYNMYCGPDHQPLNINPIIKQVVAGASSQRRFFTVYDSGYRFVDPSAQFTFSSGISEADNFVAVIEKQAAFGTMTHASAVTDILYFYFAQVNGVPLPPVVDTITNNFGFKVLPYLLTPLLPAYNLPTLNSSYSLVLDVLTIAKIYMGNITFWDHADIVALNPTLVTKLPHQPITLIIPQLVVSGPKVTSAVSRILLDVFTMALGVQNLGVGTILNGVDWPAPSQFFVTSDDQIQAGVLNVPYSFGVMFSEFTINAPFAKMKNSFGNAISSPDVINQQACLTGMSYDALSFMGVYLSPDPQCWPLTMVESIMLVSEHVSPHCDEARKTVEYLQWIMSLVGDEKTTVYVPLPASFIEAAGQALQSVTCDGISIASPIPEYSNSNGVVALMNACGSIGLIMTFFTLLGLAIFRNARQIRRASRNFLVGCLVGCFMLYIVPLLLAVQPPTDATCVLTLFLFSYGYTLALGCLYVRVWRVARIFGNRKFNVVRISDQKLWAMIGVILVLDTLILLPWVGSGTLKATSTVSDYNAASPQRTIHYACQSDVNNTFRYVLGAAKLGLLLVGQIVTYRGRNIQTDFNERGQVLTVSNITVFAIVFVSALTILNSDYAGLSVTVAIFWATTTLLAMIFWPKFWGLVRDSGWASIFTFSDTSLVSRLAEAGKMDEASLKAIIKQFSEKLRAVRMNERTDSALGLNINNIVGVPGTPVAAASTPTKSKYRVTGQEADLRQYVTLLELRLAQLDGDDNNEQVRAALHKRKNVELSMSRSPNSSLAKKAGAANSNAHSNISMVDLGSPPRSGAPPSPLSAPASPQASTAQHKPQYTMNSGMCTVSEMDEEEDHHGVGVHDGGVGGDGDHRNIVTASQVDSQVEDDSNGNGPHLRNSSCSTGPITRMVLSEIIHEECASGTSTDRNHTHSGEKPLLGHSSTRTAEPSVSATTTEDCTKRHSDSAPLLTPSTTTTPLSAPSSAPVSSSLTDSPIGSPLDVVVKVDDSVDLNQEPGLAVLAAQHQQFQKTSPRAPTTS